MAIIDKTYFEGELIIPNVTKEEVQKNLNLFIEKYEKRFLTSFLGFELYAGFKMNAIDITPIEQKWIDLLNGVIYTRTNNRKDEWVGFKGKGNVPRSPIANYVYFYWMQDHVSVSSELGETLPKAENSEVVSPAAKMCRAWNEMVDWLNGLVGFLQVDPKIYPGWENQRIYELNREFSKISEYGI